MGNYPRGRMNHKLAGMNMWTGNGILPHNYFPRNEKILRPERRVQVEKHSDRTFQGHSLPQVRTS